MKSESSKKSRGLFINFVEISAANRARSTGSAVGATRLQGSATRLSPLQRDPGGGCCGIPASVVCTSLIAGHATCQAEWQAVEDACAPARDGTVDMSQCQAAKCAFIQCMPPCPCDGMNEGCMPDKSSTCCGGAGGAGGGSGTLGPPGGGSCPGCIDGGAPPIKGDIFGARFSSPGGGGGGMGGMSGGIFRPGGSIWDFVGLLRNGYGPITGMPQVVPPGQGGDSNIDFLNPEDSSSYEVIRSKAESCCLCNCSTVCGGAGGCAQIADAIEKMARCSNSFGAYLFSIAMGFLAGAATGGLIALLPLGLAPLVVILAAIAIGIYVGAAFGAVESLITSEECKRRNIPKGLESCYACVWGKCFAGGQGTAVRSGAIVGGAMGGIAGGFGAAAADDIWKLIWTEIIGNGVGGGFSPIWDEGAWG